MREGEKTDIGGQRDRWGRGRAKGREGERERVSEGGNGKERYRGWREGVERDMGDRERGRERGIGLQKREGRDTGMGLQRL